MNAPALALAGSMENRTARSYRLMCRAIHHHHAVYRRANVPVTDERLGRILKRCSNLVHLVYRLAVAAGERV